MPSLNRKKVEAWVDSVMPRLSKIVAVMGQPTRVAGGEGIWGCVEVIWKQDGGNWILWVDVPSRNAYRDRPGARFRLTVPMYGTEAQYAVALARRLGVECFS